MRWGALVVNGAAQLTHCGAILPPQPPTHPFSFEADMHFPPSRHALMHLPPTHPTPPHPTLV